MKKGKNKGAGARPNLYGFHAVRTAWLNPQRHIKALYITDQAAKGFEQTLQDAKSKNLKRPEPARIDKHELERMLPKGAVHQGLGLEADNLPETDVQDFIISAGNRERTILIMLDQVTDPHNVGAILRSACAFGALGMILQKKHAPDLNTVLAKTACGALEHLPVAYETNLSRTLEALKESGFFAVGLDERGKISIGDYTPSEKIVLVLGAEGEGLRRLVAENCDELVRLPTSGPILSLNVSNAAAVALFSLSR